MGKASRRKKDLVPTKTKTRIFLLRVLNYMGVPVVIRRIDQDLYEYIVCIKNEIYSDNMRFTPKQGATTLTDVENNAAMQMILAGAFTTIEYQLKIEQTPQQQAKAQEFLKVAETAFGEGKPAES